VAVRTGPRRAPVRSPVFEFVMREFLSLLAIAGGGTLPFLAQSMREVRETSRRPSLERRAGWDCDASGYGFLGDACAATARQVS
jgi:hypothetical protein